MLVCMLHIPVYYDPSHHNIDSELVVYIVVLYVLFQHNWHRRRDDVLMLLLFVVAVVDVDMHDVYVVVKNTVYTWI